GKNLTAVIDLRRHQRVVHHGLGVAGHLTNDAEHFAEVAEARAKRLGQLGQLLFVDVELLTEAVAALFFGSQGGLGPLQHLALLVACLAELLLTPLVQRVLLTAGTTHLLEKLVEAVRLLLRGLRRLLARHCGTGRRQHRNHETKDKLFHRARSGAETGSVKSSGAACLRAMRRARSMELR